MILLALFACTPDDTAKNDTSVFEPACDRIHEASGILMFDVGDEITTHTPNEAPSSESKTTTVAGPLSDGSSYVMAYAGQINVSENDGCDWASTGNLPVEGDWDLIVSGDRLYAFDRAAPRGARSDDLGQNWDDFTLAGPVLGSATADPTNPDRVVAVTSGGVQRTDDGGATWTLAGDLPAGFDTTAGAIYPGDLDEIVIVGNGVQYSMTGGSTWTDVTDKLEVAATGTGVSVSPDNGDVWYAAGVGAEGPLIQRSADRGVTWAEITSNFDDGALAAAPQVWAVAGDVMQSVTVSTSDTGVSMYLTTAGTGTQKVGVGTYLGITDIVAEADHILASVHAVP